MQSIHETEIKPIGRLSMNWAELWQNRELVFFFVWRDFKVKYKQTVIGVLWVFIQPLTFLGIFYLAFNKVMQQQLEGLSYPFYIFSGLVLWQLFSATVSHAAESMIANATIIKKIYFPRLIIPLAAVGNALIDFIILFIFLLIAIFIAGVSVQIYTFLFMIWAIVLAVLSSFGIGCFLAALNIKYRDMRYALPFLMQLLLFSSTVLYPLKNLPEHFVTLLKFHPFNGALYCWRVGFQENAVIDYTYLLFFTVYAIIVSMIGIYYFRKTEAYFADLA